MHFECQKGIRPTNCTREFFLIYFSKFPLTTENMKKTRKKKMSCHNGNIPAGKEFVLFYRKKHYSRMKEANVECQNLTILD